MAAIHDRGIALRRLDYSETSQVLVIFTRDHGQQRLIARGIKRSTRSRVAVGIDLLELGSLVYMRRPGKEENLGTLTEWRQEENFQHLREDLVRCYAAQYAAEMTAQLTEIHDPHAAVFDGLVTLFRAFADRPVLTALAGYLWLLLTEIGLRPELARCMSCGRDVGEDSVLYFSSREGGALCRDCEPASPEKMRVDRRAAAELANDAFSLESERSEVVRMARGAMDLLEYHLTQIVGRPPRLAEPLKTALIAQAGQRRGSR